MSDDPDGFWRSPDTVECTKKIDIAAAKSKVDCRKIETECGKARGECGKAEADTTKAEADCGKAGTDCGKAEAVTAKAGTDCGKAGTAAAKADTDCGKVKAVAKKVDLVARKAVDITIKFLLEPMRMRRIPDTGNWEVSNLTGAMRNLPPTVPIHLTYPYFLNRQYFQY